MLNTKEELTAEKAALDARLARLTALMANENGPASAEYPHLIRQHHAMSMYSFILGKRLELAAAPEPEVDGEGEDEEGEDEEGEDEEGELVEDQTPQGPPPEQPQGSPPEQPAV